MLRENAALFGRTEDYTIYDQADMRHVIEWLSPEAYERFSRHPAAPLIAEVWREAEEELRRSATSAPGRRSSTRR